MTRALTYTYAVPILALTFGFTGTLQAAGDAQSGNSQQSRQSQMEETSQGTGQDGPRMKTIQGQVQKVEGEIYTIKDKEGKEVRLRIEEEVVQGNKPGEGDTLQAKVLMGEIMYNVISAKKAGQGGSGQTQNQMSQGETSQDPTSQEQTSQGQASQGQAGQSSSMQGQSPQSQQGQPGQFTKSIQGTVQKVEGNIYYVQTDKGEEVRLRLDQSAQVEGKIQEGDSIEALVTQEKEFHVISAQASQ